MLAVVGTRQGPRQLFVRKLDQLQPAPLAGTEGAEGPFFSPDGQWIGFFASGKLKKVSVAGGGIGPALVAAGGTTQVRAAAKATPDSRRTKGWGSLNSMGGGAFESSIRHSEAPDD